MLSVEAVQRRFGSLVALDQVSFRVGRGEAVGFIGRNGAGKTTTMRVILGLLAADSGEVIWEGRPITMEDRHAIGYMPEERGLYPKMAVRDQLEYFARLSGLSTSDARTNVASLLDQLGVASRASARLEKLSLGNQQRVQLAAALVGNPKMLILDEPFSGLDPVGVDVLANVLSERIAGGIPVLFSSHQLELVERLCDRVVMIEKGRIVRDENVRIEDNMHTYHLRLDESVTREKLERLLVSINQVSEVASAELLDDPGIQVVFREPAGNTAAVLRSALEVGNVVSFAPFRPSLVDRFRGSVDPHPAPGATQDTPARKSRWTLGRMGSRGGN